MPRRLTQRQIAVDLAERIRNGEYPPGSQLPSYRQLADLYSVSVSTAQRVILILSVQGLVQGEPGRGTFVVDVLPPKQEGAPGRP